MMNKLASELNTNISHERYYNRDKNKYMNLYKVEKENSSLGSTPVSYSIISEIKCSYVIFIDTYTYDSIILYVSLSFIMIHIHLYPNIINILHAQVL